MSFVYSNIYFSDEQQSYLEQTLQRRLVRQAKSLHKKRIVKAQAWKEELCAKRDAELKASPADAESIHAAYRDGLESIANWLRSAVVVKQSSWTFDGRGQVPTDKDSDSTIEVPAPWVAIDAADALLAPEPELAPTELVTEPGGESGGSVPPAAAAVAEPGIEDNEHENPSEAIREFRNELLDRPTL